MVDLEGTLAQTEVLHHTPVLGTRTTPSLLSTTCRLEDTAQLLLWSMTMRSLSAPLVPLDALVFVFYRPDAHLDATLHAARSRSPVWSARIAPELGSVQRPSAVESRSGPSDWATAGA